ncbi:MAG: stage II sporulation protein R [Clostridia bacterium]|nr:stage II sporulation protein R [Clostridia bacterium]
MPKFCKALAVGLVACLVLSLCSFGGQCADIRDKVVRVHVLANSDSKEDQALKLKVRDAVLTAADGMLEACDDREQALCAIEACLPELTAAAEERVAAEGYDYPVKVGLCRMYFTTREYDSGTLPAGLYDALRVEIGAAEGQNWWCVVFPTICLPASGGSWDSVLTSDEVDIVENPEHYTIGFKVVEWWESFFECFREKS